MLNGCQEVPVEMPPPRVRGHLALHWLLWSGKGSVLMGLLFLASGGEHEGSFQVYVLAHDDE